MQLRESRHYPNFADKLTNLSIYEYWKIANLELMPLNGALAKRNAPYELLGHLTYFFHFVMFRGST